MTRSHPKLWSRRCGPPEVGTITVVHSETPSGTLNPVADARWPARLQAELLKVTLIDCVSSLGGMPFAADD